MEDMNKKVKITNRSNGTAIYEVPEMHVRRQFAPRSSQIVPMEELVQVSYQPGGRALLYHYFFIEDIDVVHEVIGVKEEPEYYLSEADIPNWMQTCSLDQFIDALNFAPEGIKDLIKKYAVDLPLKDLDKLDQIKQVLDFNALAAIENNKASGEEEKQPTRLANSTSILGDVPQPEIVTPAPTRKTTPTYKVVKKSD